MAKATSTVEGPMGKYSTPPAASNAPVTGPKVPWIQLVYEKNQNFKDVKAAIPDVSENDVILVNGPNGPFEKLESFQTFVVAGQEFFVQRDMAGKALKVKTAPENPGGKEADGTRQEYEALLIILHGDKLIPATMSFRAACCRAALSVVAAVNESVSEPKAFADRGAAFKAALAIPIPFARVYGDIKVFNEKNKRSPGSHRAADATIFPTTEKLKKLLEAASSDPAYNQAFSEAAENHERRVQELTK